MRLLKITDRENEDVFEQHFEETEHANIDEITPEVRNNKADVKIGGESVERFDAVYADIPAKNATFGRVLLEIIEEKGIAVNCPSTAFFIMSKKNYLYHVLHEKDVSAVKTAVIASEKAVRNIERELKGPLVARRFDDEIETERTRLETVEEIQEFADGIDRGNKFVVFHELRKGDKYRCLVIGDSCISLADNSEDWDFSDDNLKYHSVSKERRETAIKARKTIGASVAEVMIRGDKVEDVDPNPNLELYRDISGKNPYDKIASELKEDEE